MRLFHYTSVERLVGLDGLLAMKAAGGDCNALEFARPGSILRDGLEPRGETEAAVAGLLPTCVWFTTDPEMPFGFSAGHDVRIDVVIPSTGRQLFHWPKWMRKHAGPYARDGMKDAEAIFKGRVRTDDWWILFAIVAPGAFRAIELVERNEADRQFVERWLAERAAA
jgi:hypothetical protein